MITLDNFFSGLGATLIISIFGVFIASFPLFSLTVEEKPLINNNIRLFRRVILEIVALLLFLLMSVNLINFKLKDHISINEFPYISNYVYANYFVVAGVFVLLILFPAFILIRNNIRFRNYIFNKIRLLKNIRRIASITIFLMFVIIFYIYLFAPFLCVGYLLNLFLFFLGQQYKIEAATTTDVLFELFSLPGVVAFTFILLYLILYFFVRVIYKQLFAFRKLIGYSKVTATIHLTNGSKLDNKTIVRPSIDGSILLCDTGDNSKKILLPKQNILYIEFVIKHITLHTETDN
ncbi:hypothetical protein [Cohnella lupini]|uniref:Uncharacterized protein n=1 Tax=Cohnella lupini TaxID=1294267 RepID=A0A3D9I9R5_9BACL|nr:hypothetical protein [Cohnella lupini]RED58513.1 hypothetical protein DFP95_10837 [Cohnella lupini]